MKIDSSNHAAALDSVQLSGAAQTQTIEAGKSKAAAAGAGAGAGTDQVALSNLSQALRTESEDTPERTAYLDKLSKLVASGEYNPDASGIAKSMVDDLVRGGF